MVMRTKPGRELLATWLQRNGHSKLWLSRELATSERNVYRWLNGDRQPRIEALAAIEKLTGVPATSWAIQGREAA